MGRIIEERISQRGRGGEGERGRTKDKGERRKEKGERRSSRAEGKGDHSPLTNHGEGLVGKGGIRGRERGGDKEIGECKFQISNFKFQNAKWGRKAMLNGIKGSAHFTLREFQCKGTNCCGGAVKASP